MEPKEITKNFLRGETCSACAFFYKKDNSCYLNLDMSFDTCGIWSSSISDFVEEETRKRVEEAIGNQTENCCKRFDDVLK